MGWGHCMRSLLYVCSSEPLWSLTKMSQCDLRPLLMTFQLFLDMTHNVTNLENVCYKCVWKSSSTPQDTNPGVCKRWLRNHMQLLRAFIVSPIRQHHKRVLRFSNAVKMCLILSKIQHVCKRWIASLPSMHLSVSCCFEQTGTCPCILR